MLRSHLFLFSFTIILLMPWWVRAAPVCQPEQGYLVVSFDCTLPAAHPFRLKGLSVVAGASLTIEPGATVYFSTDAQVRIQGGIHAVGNERQPIQFLAATEAELWQGFTVAESAPEVTLAYLTFSRFREPVTLLSQNVQLDHLTLTDGVDNLLLIGTDATMYRSDISIGWLSFSNLHQGSRMSDSGVRIRGTLHDLRIDHVAIQDSRPEIAPGVLIGAEVIGHYNSLYIVADYPHECPAHIEEPIRAEHYVSRFLPTYCYLHERRPVVFVPGFGASINLHQLTQPPDASKASSGWRFFNYFTPSYSALLTDLAANGLSYTVAYYDWRLPAEESARLYLKPAIEAAKKAYGTDYVDIVAHSFGGLVSRAYIQSSAYAGDVGTLVELGTPNHGAAKAYAPWEAGVLPPDWQSLSILMRYYGHLLGNHRTTVETLHYYAPSVGELTPVYPAILDATGGVRSPAKFCLMNPFLTSLTAGEGELKARVRLATVVGTGQETMYQLSVSKQVCGNASWPDGVVEHTQTTLEGDGTVPQASITVPGIPLTTIVSGHQELPEKAAEAVYNILYPGWLYFSPTFTHLKPGLSFVFDCPIIVTLKLPDGGIARSDQEDAAGVEVASAPEMTWLVAPREVGEYQLAIKATAKTEVRGWVDDGTPIVRTFEQGQEELWRYQTDEKHWLVPLISTLPSTPTPVATTIPTPMPTTMTTAIEAPVATQKAAPAVRVTSSSLRRPTAPSPEATTLPISSTPLPKPTASGALPSQAAVVESHSPDKPTVRYLGACITLLLAFFLIRRRRP